jgi:transcriptional regulator with XRE-family HTH domain/archaellum biogenesis ATPase FlaH
LNLPKTKRDYIDLYVSLGFTPIPIYAGEKKPSVHWEEWQTKRPSKDKIRSWFDYTDRDVATICGNVSDGLVVIDCDNQATFDLITKNIELVKKTIIVKSPHGWHIYLRTDNVPTPRHYRLDDIKLDILGEGSIVVLPPSTSSAGVYAFDASLSTDDYTILRMDNVIGTVEDALRIVGIDVAKATSLRSDNERLGDEGFRELLANVKEGNRHDVVLRATNYLKQKSSLSLEAIYDYLAPYVLNCPAEHSWTDKELRAEILKAFNYKSNEQRYFEKNNPQPLKMKNPDDIKEAQLGESLIDGVLHRSDVILLYAPSGEGKSIYATNICAALINGTRALELWNTRKCRVGFADYEMPVGELKLRFHEILGNTLGYSNFFTESFQGRRLINEAHIDELEANIKELKLDVLIIDNLSSASGTVKDENTGVQRDVMDTIRGLAKRTNCAIIVIHHTGKPKYDPDGNSVRMTPRGHSSISDASDVELQILKTERENVTSLLCTKSRGVRNTIRKEWRRDFYYDSDSFTITPLNEEDSTKTTTVARLKSAKEALKIGDRELGDLLSVNFSTVARWLRGENLPSETRLSKIREIIENLENRLGKSVSSENATLAQRLEGNERAPYINKKNDVSQTETKTSSVKHNSAKAKKTTIDLNNPCASCPACKEKTTRFVDGEGTCSNGIMFIAQCPGEVEMTTTPRRPLIGPAGQEFNRLLKVAYIKREECRITNLVTKRNREV